MCQAPLRASRGLAHLCCNDYHCIYREGNQGSEWQSVGLITSLPVYDGFPRWACSLTSETFGVKTVSLFNLGANLRHNLVPTHYLIDEKSEYREQM